MPNRPHIAWPVQLDSTGRIYMVEQGSDRDIASCMATCVLWPIGSRDLNRDFGVSNPVGKQGGPDLDEMHTQLLLNEPRADNVVSLDDDTLPHLVAQVRVGFDQTSGSPTS